jgi:hypothetical protein
MFVKFLAGFANSLRCIYLLNSLSKELKMPQLKLSVGGMSSKQDGDRLVEQTSGVAGVRFVNANHEEGYVVITHGDGFDVEAYKAAAKAAGFTA